MSSILTSPIYRTRAIICMSSSLGSRRSGLGGVDVAVGGIGRVGVWSWWSEFLRGGGVSDGAGGSSSSSE